MNRILCTSCKKRILRHEYHVNCCLCKLNCHKKCLPLFNETDFEYAKNVNNSWSCKNCNENIFPFNHIEEDVEFLRTICDDYLIDMNDRLFHPFEFDNVENDDPLVDIDPDYNFYNIYSNSTLKDSYYYTCETFKNYIADYDVTNDNFSLYHMNIRSMCRNLKCLNTYMSTLPVRFSCIALTETWLNKNTADYTNIEGYNHIYKYRTNRSGGGVSLLLNDKVSFTIRDDLSEFNDSHESLFIEIDKGVYNTKSNIVIGVIYRIPGQDINIFNTYFKKALEKIKQENKIVYYTGDFNINILNANEHSATNDFIELIFSSSCIPLYI